MTPSGISQILEQIGRVVIGVGLAYFLFDKGIEYSAGGAALEQQEEHLLQEYI